MTFGQGQDAAAAGQANALPKAYPTLDVTSALSEIQKILHRAEVAELQLAYLSEHKDEGSRLKSGSFYTPIDVAHYFWDQFFLIAGLETSEQAISFLKAYRFIEPSAGAGALVFSLFHKLISLGVGASALRDVEIEIIDVNGRALFHIREELEQLGSLLGVEFLNIKMVECDFLNHQVNADTKPLVLFGNPPFVKNESGKSQWKNSFADFVERSQQYSALSGYLHYIVPLSVAFSRDYQALRAMLVNDANDIVTSHYDNIPDTLFKYGKPKHSNTNKANSQRCTFLTTRPSNEGRVFSTRLHRWKKSDREKVLSSSPTYLDVTNASCGGQIIRPESDVVLEYLSNAGTGCVLGDLLSATSDISIYVSGVARNYVGIRENLENGVVELRLKSNKDFHKVLLILASDLFLDYWRTVGDGFHVTKSVICKFPISARLDEIIEPLIPLVREVWKDRRSYQKSKLNRQKYLHSYDLSGALPSLISEINHR